MVGRGLRQAPGKKDCIVLDQSGNTNAHGPVANPAQHAASLGVGMLAVCATGTGAPVWRFCKGCNILMRVPDDGRRRTCEECCHAPGQASGAAPTTKRAPTKAAGAPAAVAAKQPLADVTNLKAQVSSLGVAAPRRMRKPPTKPVAGVVQGVKA